MGHVLAKELKDSILQNAVLGKLTKAEENDTPIDNILSKLVIDKKLKNCDEPFDIPETWKWIQIGNLGKSVDTESFSDGPFGSNLKKEHQTIKPEVRIIQLSNIGENGWKNDNEKYTTYEHLKTIARCEVHPGDFVIAKMMPAGRTIIVPDLGTKITLGSDAVKFVPNPILNKDYLLLAMKSNVFISQVYSEVHGITRVRTSLNKIKSYSLPIPPIEEQQRIVDKVDELMAKIDEYEKIENQLVQLKEEFPKDVKAAILHSALNGYLSLDNTEFDSIFDLLINNEIEFTQDCEIRESWAIVKAKDVLKTQSGNSKLIKGCQQTKKTDSNYDAYSASGQDVYTNTYEHEGKAIILSAVGARCGKAFKADGKWSAIANTHIIIPNEDVLNFEYAYYILNNENWWIRGGNTAQPFVSVKQSLEQEIKLPPIEEQQRIVDLLDKVLPLCDSLQEA